MWEAGQEGMDPQGAGHTRQTHQLQQRARTRALAATGCLAQQDRASNVTKPHFPALLKAGCDHVFHRLANETWAEVCEPSRKTGLEEPLTWSFSVSKKGTFLFFSPFPPFCVFPRSRKMMAGALAAMSDQTW